MPYSEGDCTNSQKLIAQCLLTSELLFYPFGATCLGPAIHTSSNQFKLSLVVYLACVEFSVLWLIFINVAGCATWHACLASIEKD